MSPFGPASPNAETQRYDAIETIRRAFTEFLALPTFVIAGFLLLAAGSYALDQYALDQGRVVWLEQARAILQARVFVDAKATADLLSTIAGGIITVTSITISLLLLALQQVAGSLTAEVYDQFLRRKHNQGYFGFFIGLALFALVTLATVNDGFNPVMGATLAFVLTVVALYVLLVLLYTTINQMRPVEVIGEIQRFTLGARRQQLKFIRRTRSSASLIDARRLQVTAGKNGYVTSVDLDLLDAAARDAGGGIEFVLTVSYGSYVAFHDVIAEIRTPAAIEIGGLGDRVRAAIRLERQQNLAADPSHGIRQLELIAWTSVSTAKSDPSPGLMVIHSLRDVLARWAEVENDTPTGAGGDSKVPVVYTDTVPAALMHAFESIAVVSTESMQHQTFAEVLRAFSITFHRLPVDQQARAEDLVRRILSGLGDHVLTARLEAELSTLAQVLSEAGRTEVAAAVERSRDALKLSVGRINSRATRLKEQSDT